MERPPLRLTINSRSANGRHARFAKDEKRPEDKPSGLSFSSVVPGGHENCGFTLPRQSGREYPDLAPLSQITVQGAGGGIAFQGRLEQTPSSSGAEVSVSPSAVGNQAFLDDDKTAREIYRDIDLGRWGGMSRARKVAHQPTYTVLDPETAVSDVANGRPCNILAVQGSFSSGPLCEAWYDAGGSRIGSLYYRWDRETSTVDPAAGWVWGAYLATDDTGSGTVATGNLAALGPGFGTLNGNHRHALLQFYYPSPVDDRRYGIVWSNLAVYGNHGLVKRGIEPRAGFYASDIAPHAVRKYTGLTVRDENIVATSFVIEQAAFHDPTTAAEIVRAANRFELYDWAVWDHMEFHYAPRGHGGRVWRARVGEAKLEETGPDVARIFNGVAVPYQDVDGSAKMVGPPGSGSDTESTDLVDLDPDNPVNQLGQQRWELLPSIGVATAAMATEIGRRWLQEQKLADSSGRASLIGYCTDDKGIVRPAWQVRAGDRIVFTDAHDASRQRRIVKASYDDDSKTCSIDLDAPPSTHEALLSRIADGQQSLGIG